MTVESTSHTAQLRTPGQQEIATSSRKACVNLPKSAAEMNYQRLSPGLGKKMETKLPASSKSKHHLVEQAAVGALEA